MKRDIRFASVLVVLVMTGLACSLVDQAGQVIAPQPVNTSPAPVVTLIAPTAQAAATAAIEPSPAPVEAQVTTKTIQNQTTDPALTVDIEYPFLEATPGVSADAFNAAVEQMLVDQQNAIRDAAQPPPPDLPDVSNSLNIRYEIRSPGPRVLSVYYSLSSYVAGAAHPLPWSLTMNYLLQEGRMLELSDLFQPGSDYLKVLSGACIADLQARGVLEWQEGAAPEPENFKSWNVTPQGLQITFDPYQVASYAAGFQAVTIPWEKLSGILSQDALLP